MVSAETGAETGNTQPEGFSQEGTGGTVMWGMGENDAWMGKGKSTW